MSLVNQLLLNILGIIAPIMLYQVFWMDRLQHAPAFTNRVIITAGAAAIAIFCMSHPFEFASGFRYDLRLVPLVLCFFYAGPGPATLVVLAIITYRLYLGGTGSYAGSITAVLLLGLLLLASRLVKPGSRLRNTAMGAVLGLLIGFFLFLVTWAARLVLHLDTPARELLFFLLDGVVYSFTLALSINIIEQIKQNIEARRRSQHSDKMQMLGELAASFAHEIRNPMTVARGFMQMLKQPGLPTEKRQIYSQMVLEEMDKTQAIINDYLSFAKPSLESIELLDAKALIERAVRSIETYASMRQVRINAELQDKMIISCNAEKFIQCIVNLCKNGIEAMPAGGALQIAGSLQSETVCIDIIDQGVGMTQEEINRLGTPYYSTRGKGTGLSMMVTYRVIQNIQGTIHVTSEPGKGTCFSLLIPAIPSSSYH